MIVTVLLSVTKAYVSVLSATGSLEMPGASRCDDIVDLLLGRPQHFGHEPLVGEHHGRLADEHFDLARRDVAHVYEQWPVEGVDLVGGQVRLAGAGSRGQ